MATDVQMKNDPSERKQQIMKLYRDDHNIDLTPLYQSWATLYDKVSRTSTKSGLSESMLNADQYQSKFFKVQINANQFYDQL